jgi:hypothetical protein
MLTKKSMRHTISVFAYLLILLILPHSFGHASKTLVEPDICSSAKDVCCGLHEGGHTGDHRSHFQTEDGILPQRHVELNKPLETQDITVNSYFYSYVLEHRADDFIMCNIQFPQEIFFFARSGLSPPILSL